MNDVHNWKNEPMEAKHREIAESETGAKNENNKRWWEALPMTYVDWAADNRQPSTPEEFARVYATYFGSNPYVKETVRPELYRDKKLLEIGCGAGSASCWFAQAGAQVTAVDLTEMAVKLTSLHAATLGVAVNVIQQDAEKLPDLADETFDYVFSWGVLHHSADPDRCYSQVARVLKHGGTGLLMVYHRNSVRYWIKGLIYLLAKGRIFKGENFETIQRFFTDGFYHKHYSRTQFAHDLEKQGLKVTKVDVTHMATPIYQTPIIGKFLTNHLGWLLVAHFERR